MNESHPDVIKMVEWLRIRNLDDSRAPAESVLRVASVLLRVTPPMLDTRSRAPRHIRTRSILWWVVRRVSKASIPEVASLCGAPYATTYQGIRRVETDPAMLEDATKLALQLVETESNWRWSR